MSSRLRVVDVEGEKPYQGIRKWLAIIVVISLIGFILIVLSIVYLAFGYSTRTTIIFAVVGALCLFGVVFKIEVKIGPRRSGRCLFKTDG